MTAATLVINGDLFDCPFADLLPPLTDEERAGLRADIAQNGVLQPVIFTRHNGRFVLIDGHNRAGVAAELGLRVPVCEKKYENFEAMKRHALELNVHRRHLTREQRRELVAAVLKADPSRSDRAIAAQAGVSDKTVAAVRADSGAEIPHLDTRTGKDGKRQPAKKAKSTRKAVPVAPVPAPEPPGEPADMEVDGSAEDEATFVAQSGVGWGTPLPSDLTELAAQLKLWATMVGQCRNVERVNVYLDAIQKTLRDCERELRAAVPVPAPVVTEVELPF